MLLCFVYRGTTGPQKTKHLTRVMSWTLLRSRFSQSRLHRHWFDGVQCFSEDPVRAWGLAFGTVREAVQACVHYFNKYRTIKGITRYEFFPSLPAFSVGPFLNTPLRVLSNMVQCLQNIAELGCAG